jgi:hypothetical protein
VVLGYIFSDYQISSPNPHSANWLACINHTNMQSSEYSLDMDIVVKNV